MSKARWFALLAIAPLTISVPRYAIGSDMDNCPECYDCGYGDDCDKCMREYDSQRYSQSYALEAPPPASHHDDGAKNPMPPSGRIAGD
jgi:hypothetical protein